MEPPRIPGRFIHREDLWLGSDLTHGLEAKTLVAHRLAWILGRPTQSADGPDLILTEAGTVVRHDEGVFREHEPCPAETWLFGDERGVAV